MALGNKPMVNALAVSGAALFFTQTLHEGVHLLTALLVGVEVHAFNLFAVDTRLFRDGSHLFEDIAVEASASLVNILIGIVAAVIIILRKRYSGTKPCGYPLISLFFFQLAGFSLLMGFGYLLFDGAFYAPGAYGDWKSIIGMVENPGMLRGVLMIIGAAGVVGTYFFLARGVLLFVHDISNSRELRSAARTVLLIPYLSWSILYTALALFHPLGFPDGLIIVFFQFFFGFSGFFWGYMLASRWLVPRPFTEQPCLLPRRLSMPWLIVTGLLLVIQIALFLPTISLV